MFKIYLVSSQKGFRGKMGKSNMHYYIPIQIYQSIKKIISTEYFDCSTQKNHFHLSIEKESFNELLHSIISKNLATGFKNIIKIISDCKYVH